MIRRQVYYAYDKIANWAPGLVLPGQLATRLGPALGLPPGGDPAALPWWAGLEDGVYLPTNEMVRGEATAYVPGATIAGGIYVRGTVRVLRAMAKGDISYYLFAVDKDPADGRLYAIRMDRATRATELRAFPLRGGKTLGGVLAEAGNDPQALFALPATEATALAAWASNSAGEATRMAFAAAPGARAPFDGVIAVDLGRHDPLRDPLRPGVVRPATADLPPPLVP